VNFKPSTVIIATIITLIIIMIILMIIIIIIIISIYIAHVPYQYVHMRINMPIKQLKSPKSK